MHIVYLAGNSPHNKGWIEKVKGKFDSFSTGEVLYYDHWKSGKKLIDWGKETEKVVEMVKDKNEYFVLAKSVGTVLVLKAMAKGVFKPKKAIFCGFPGRLDKKNETVKIPTIFVQNEFDPVYSYEKMKQALEKNKPVNSQLIKNPRNNTHDYEDYEQLVSLAKEFFVG